MAAANTDYFTEVGNPGTATTLAAPGHTSGGTSITVVSTSNWPTTTGVIFAMDTVSLVNGEEVRDVGSYREYEGVVASATSITNMTIRYGSDRDFPAGSTTRVYIPVSSSRENRLVQGLTATVFDQDGTLKAGAVDVAAVLADGIVTNAKMATAVKPVTIADETTFDFIASGLVWSGDSYGSTLAASMTSGVVYIDGNRVAVSAVTSRAFAASKDTYIDVGTDGVVDYNEVANNAASPALNASHIRIGIIITGAGNIANAGSVNQGQEDKVLPIASSVPYAVTDSLGNLICPRDPSRRIIGYRQIVGSITTTSATAVQITGLSIPMNALPTTRKVKVSLVLPTPTTSGNNNIGVVIYNGTVPSGTLITEATLSNTGTGEPTNIRAEKVYTPTSASATLNAGFYINGGSTFDTNAASTRPAYLMVELE